MTVTEYLKNWLTTSTLMSEFTGVHVDFTKNVPNECGLYYNGNSKVGEDILGNAKWQTNFILYSGLRAFADYDRLNNSDFLVKLSYSLSEIKDAQITETINGIAYKGKITQVKASNAMLYSIPSGDINDGVTYQLQIQVNYTISDEQASLSI